VVYLTESRQITGEVLHVDAVSTTAMVSPSSSQHASAERRLQDLGIVLPTLPIRLAHTSRQSNQAACSSLVECCRSRVASLNTSGAWARNSMQMLAVTLCEPRPECSTAAKEHLGSLIA